MEDQKIISILKQARSLTPDKKWENIAREAMLVYTQNPPKERSGIFGMLTRYRSAPYLVMGSVMALVLITGSISLTSSNTLQIGDSEPVILSQEKDIEVQETTIPSTNETIQGVLGFLTSQPTTPHQEPQDIGGYENIPEIQQAFETYLTALDTIDTQTEEGIEDSIYALQGAADTFIASLGLDIQPEETFGYALRIAVTHRQQQCSDTETQEGIQALLDENTTTALVEANTLSLQCEKDFIPLNT